MLISHDPLHSIFFNDITSEFCFRAVSSPDRDMPRNIHPWWVPTSLRQQSYQRGHQTHYPEEVAAPQGATLPTVRVPTP